jgi:hypothetical protein
MCRCGTEAACNKRGWPGIGNLDSGKFLQLKSEIPKISNWTAACVEIRID